MSTYFQRKLVWRIIHKIDFIKTILYGYPFPEIFMAKGDLDVEKMESKAYIVDGQQRLNSIVEYIADKFEVDGKKFSQLDYREKEEFFKYDITIIDLDIKKDDPVIKEIFKRLNRTFYSLTFIEKLSTEYGPTDLMLLAKLISGELKTKDEISVDDFGEIDPEPLEFDPEVPNDFIEWSRQIKIKKFKELILENFVFTSYEISRQVHLMFCLNILGTIKYDIYNRNITRELLENYSENFDSKEEIINNLEAISSKILKAKFKKKSAWYNKANLFSLIIAFYRNKEKILQIPDIQIRQKFESFIESPPADYKISAKEGVNNRKERLTRDMHIQTIIDSFP
jgi:hypothetical protein